jgi:hypothetical protein
MSRTYLDRRQVLKGLGVGALAAGATAALSPMTALADDDHKGPIGAWNINIHEEGQPSRQAVAGLAAGGVFTTVDSLGPGAVGLGAWNKEEDKHFAFKFTVYDFTHGGVPVVVAGNGTVTENSIQGSVTAKVFGTTVGTGTFDGTRMTV